MTRLLRRLYGTAKEAAAALSSAKQKRNTSLALKGYERIVYLKQSQNQNENVFIEKVIFF